MQKQTQVSETTDPSVTFKTLNNGIKFSVARLAESAKAAISVSIRQGHFHAVNYPDGFAHLLEHMLFNPSNKYQKTNDLDQHVAKFNGQVNGWTQDLMTNYQLSCDPQGFVDACDILIDRLSHPLFELTHIEREISAIDAEFKLKKDDPIRQLLSVHKATCSPKHPFSRFSTGNKETLSKISVEETQTLLKQLHQHTMQGANICICLAIPESQITNADVDHLQTLIDNNFHTLSTTSAHIPPTNLYQQKHLNTLIQIQGKQHQLMISFVLQQLDLGVSDSLLILLTHLIESKHELGLHDVLISRDWIQDLYSYYKRLDDNTFELIVGVNLTELGAHEHNQVSECILAYAHFLKQENIEKWRFREKATQYNLQAQLQAKIGALELAISISQKMHNTEFTQILAPEKFVVEDAYSMLPSVLSQMDSLHSRVVFMSAFAQTNTTSAYYNAPYSISPRTNHRFETKQSARQLKFAKPRQNPFLAGEHKVVAAELEPTELYKLNSLQVCLKFYQDIRFNLPNGECYISITDPHMFQNTQEMAIKRVWLGCLNEYLANRFFDVELASLHYRVYPHHHGISIHTSGFSERQLLLCIELINAIKTFEASATSIQRHLQHCVTRMTNNLAQKPFNQLFSGLNECYAQDDKSNQAILKALENLTVEDVLLKQTTYFAHNYIESLILGNWKVATIDRFFDQLNKRFEADTAFSKPKAHQMDLKSSLHTHVIVPELAEHNMIWHIVPELHENTATLVLSARSLLLEKLLSPIVFEVLRQRHKMGYMLGVGYKPIGGYPGVAMYLLSPTHSLKTIREAMLETVDTAKEFLNEVPHTLEQLKKGLCAQVTPKESEIGQTSSRAWLHFDDANPIMAYQELIDAIAGIELSEIMACLDSMCNSSLGQMLFTQSAHQEPVFKQFALTP